MSETWGFYPQKMGDIRNISKALGFECKLTCLGWLVVYNRELWNAVEPESVLSQSECDVITSLNERVKNYMETGATVHIKGRQYTRYCSVESCKMAKVEFFVGIPFALKEIYSIGVEMKLFYFTDQIGSTVKLQICIVNF